MRGLFSSLAALEPWPVIATAARGHVRPMVEPVKS